MGGTIAQSLAHRHPKLVRRMMLCATAPGDGHATPPARRRDPRAGQRHGESVAARLPPGHDSAAQPFIRAITSYPNASPGAPPETTRAQLTASAIWTNGGDPSGRPLSGLRLPVLVGGGALDRLLPAANQRYLARTAERPAPDLPGRRPRLLPAAPAQVRAAGRPLAAVAAAALAAILRGSRLASTRTALAGTSSGSSRLPRTARRGRSPS